MNYQLIMRVVDHVDLDYGLGAQMLDFWIANCRVEAWL
jgi:hypothetical protein